MATSSRQSTIFGVNDWKAIYRTYSEANFKNYDYESLRKTFVDYLRSYYPETFNDYTESSEYIALLDVMAFMGQALAFRDDLNTRENFIDTAERRDSVIKLANLVGYTPKRNNTAQGYLKIAAIQTTEQVRDINGLNLADLAILWNDPANPNWQEQFNSVVNAALFNSQRVGRPGNTNTILGVKTDEYSINMPQSSSPIANFSATVEGAVMDFQCVSVTSVDSDTVYELPPGPTNKFNILYRNDKLGYGSVNTGFFVYFKQGSLGSFAFNLAEKISNNIVDINVQGINNTDTWLYAVDPNTGLLSSWIQVDSVYSITNPQAILNRKIFSVNSRSNDQVSYVFGDGVFSDIPVGNFIAYYRTSNALQYSIDPVEFQGTVITIPYVSRTGRTETLTMSLQLGLPVTNAQARESLANIKQRAPTRYYTQNRMVNGEDYTNFPYTLYNSIIKSKALNRTSIGVSKNFDLLDPSGKYSSTTSVADDGGTYYDETDGVLSFSSLASNDIISFLTGPLAEAIGSERAFQYYTQYYGRYLINSSSGDGTVYWYQASYDNLESTGYFYDSSNNPKPAGVFATNNMRYITEGAMIGFLAPSGYYFDANNRLQPLFGALGPSDNNFIWTSVLNVTGDGNNNGEGLLNNGTGPIALSNSIPTGSILFAVLPSFDNSLGDTLIQECINKITLNQSFTLLFNNALLSNQERWSTGASTNTSYFVKFESSGNGTYRVLYRSLAYYFASVSNVRFTFDTNKIIYDPETGKLQYDTINMLKTNSQPNNNYPLPRDILLTIIGQESQSDGYVDDYSVEVSIGDIMKSGTYKNPDYFQQIVGYIPGQINRQYFVFFQTLIDANKLSRTVMLPTADVTYLYGSFQEINTIKYEYPVGRIYYAYQDNKFYKTENDTTSYNIVNVVEVTGYSVKTGRQGLYFSYKHLSDKTTRVDPGTTNIIDLYVVTQSYYTSYQNWIQDTTGSITEPTAPTIQELSDLYSNISEYKMLSDSVIFNSVKFKPLFGSKAEPKLRATIKVVKSSKTTASDTEVRSLVLSEMNNYFNIDNWNFGDTFYFSELSAYLHATLGDYISSVVLVPTDPTMTFGELYEIRCAPYEIFANAAQASDIIVIAALTQAELQTS